MAAENLLAVVLLFLGIGSGAMFLRTQMKYRDADADVEAARSIMEEAAEYAIRQGNANRAEVNEPTAGKAPDEPVSRELQVSQKRKARKSGLARLKQQNGDTAGWLSVPGTAIDLPVMKSEADPDFYLNHGFDGEHSVYGMAYLDAAGIYPWEQKDNLCGHSVNYVIYGHHMKNGAMFAPLAEYQDEKFYQEHKSIEFDFSTEYGDYEVIGVFAADAETASRDLQDILFPADENAYQALVRYVKDRSFYDTGVDAEFPEQLITLVTCEYGRKDGRLFVVARKKASGNKN